MIGWLKRVLSGERSTPPTAGAAGEDDFMPGYRFVDGHAFDANHRPVDLGFIEGNPEDALAIATLEGALGRPFAPLLDCGTTRHGTLVLVWPHAQPLFSAAHAHRPAAPVAVALAREMLRGSEVLARALQSAEADFERAPLLKEAHVDASGLVLRAPLARPVGPMRTGTLRGAHLLAPEQVRGKTRHPASDVFSVGAALVELLVGQPLFPVRESTLMTDMERLVRAELSAPLVQQGIPAPLAELLERSFLQVEPARRCADATAARALLEPHAASDEELQRWLDAVMSP